MKRSLQFCSFACAAAATLVFAALAVAQPQPGGPPPGPPGGFGGPGGFRGGPGGEGILGLANRPDVQQELELVDEQKDKVRDIVDGAREKAREEFRTMFEEMRDLNDDERRAKFDEIREKADAMNADLEKDLGKVLLPHQMERLKQIDLQTKVRQRGAQAVSGGDVAKALNLTDEQREKLEKRAEEVQEELRTKIRELQADARKKMFDVLTSDQQAQLQKMLGDDFNLPEGPGPGFGNGGFRGRGRGGPDGQGQGQGRGNRGGNRPPREDRAPN